MMPDYDSFWDELLTYVEAHSVIPVVGPELVVVEHQGRIEPYYRLLARELATRLKLDNPGEAATLDQVVGAYLAKPGSRRQSVYRELGDIAGKLSVEIPEPLLQLASIRDLNLYVSFSTDNLLAQAINAARFGGRAETRELSFNPSEAGDPCFLAFRRAVAAGALPFGVQGTENGLAIEGGRTLGFEMAEAFHDARQFAKDSAGHQRCDPEFAKESETGHDN